jgi:hypothetical protein
MISSSEDARLLGMGDPKDMNVLTTSTGGLNRALAPLGLSLSGEDAASIFLSFLRVMSQPAFPR